MPCRAAARHRKVSGFVSGTSGIGQSSSPGFGFVLFWFPKDLQAFVRIGERRGCDFSLLKEWRRSFAASGAIRVESEKDLCVLRGKPWLLWGMAFKRTPMTSFCSRPKLAKRLMARAPFFAIRPQAMQKAKRRATRN